MASRSRCNKDNPKRIKQFHHYYDPSLIWPRNYTSISLAIVILTRVYSAHQEGVKSIPAGWIPGRNKKGETDENPKMFDADRLGRNLLQHRMGGHNTCGI
jgi:hypothetical protein